VQQAQMKISRPAGLEAPRVEQGRPLLITGLRSHFAEESWKGIPELWRRFAQHLGKIPGQVGRTAYGLCFLQPSGVEYLAGVEVSRSSGLPSDFTTVSVQAQKYLVFSHREHVSKLHLTCATISEWLPTSGHEAAKAAGSPDFFESYTEEFDPGTGTGGIEVWVPIKW
jgi:AraC family transcriptional regulator